VLAHLNPAQKEILKKGQLTWIATRDKQCIQERDDTQTMGAGCAIDMMQARIAFLQERERECNSTGCVNAKLAE
jgi:uncharacterized protein YecT (DUF1311 family)